MRHSELFEKTFRRPSVLGPFSLTLAVACGGELKTAPPLVPDAGVAGDFVFDCVAYEDGCPKFGSAGQTSQEPVPPAIAVGSTFFLSFTPGAGAAAPGDYPLTVVGACV